MGDALAAFTEYERDFQQLTSQLPTRVNALLQYSNEADAANAEIRKIEQDITQAKQRVRVAGELALLHRVSRQGRAAKHAQHCCPKPTSSRPLPVSPSLS